MASDGRYPLSHLKGSPEAREIHVWDIETVQRDDLLVPFLVGYEGPKGFKAFTGQNCVADFAHYVFDNVENSSVIWAHNGGGFDHQFLFAAIYLDTSFEIYPVLSGSSTILMFITHIPSGKKLLFMDSLRILPMSLSEIGRKLWPDGTMNKGELDFRTTPIDDPRWIEYNARDCEILRKALIAVQSAINLLGAEMGLTGGSTALDLFRRQYLDQKLWAGYASDESLYRDSYYGGRTEIFDLRRAVGCRTYDVNSLYPYACTFPLPATFRKKVKGDNVESRELLSDSLRDDELVTFVRCKVNVPPTYVPPLPYRGDKLIFPTGTFRGTWTSADLNSLVSAGGTVREIETIVAYDGKPFAARMMTDLYRSRKSEEKTEAAQALAIACKLMMNSFYGKLGQKPEREKFRAMASAEWIKEQLENHGEPWTMHDQDGVLWKTTTFKTDPHMLPHVAAHITALARRRHYADMLLATPIYCDTDSIVTRDRLPESSDLGGMKLEHEWDWFQPLVPKMYHGEEKGKLIEKTKGFGGWNKEVFEHGTVAHLKAGGIVNVKGPTKLRGMLTSGDVRVKERTLAKRIYAINDKRTFHPDGTSTAIHLNER